MLEICKRWIVEVFFFFVRKNWEKWVNIRIQTFGKRGGKNISPSKQEARSLIHILEWIVGADLAMSSAQQIPGQTLPGLYLKCESWPFFKSQERVCDIGYKLSLEILNFAWDLWSAAFYLLNIPPHPIYFEELWICLKRCCSKSWS